MLRNLILFLNPFVYLALLVSFLKKIKWALLKFKLFYAHHSLTEVCVWGPVRILQKNSQIVIGRGTEIHPYVDLFADPQSTLKIGNKCKIGQRTQLVSHKNNILKIGDSTSFHSDCSVVGEVTIGKNCLFARHIFVSSYDHQFNKEPYLPIKEQDKKYPLISKPVKIDDDCWIGWGVAIRSGLHIGKGVIVGANSVVTKNLKPYRIYGGIPAKEIGLRLEFTPPETLIYSLAEHRPYFYENLDLRANCYQSTDAIWSLACPLLKPGTIMFKTLPSQQNSIYLTVGQKKIQGHWTSNEILTFNIDSHDLDHINTDEKYAILKFESTDSINITEVQFPC